MSGPRISYPPSTGGGGGGGTPGGSDTQVQFNDSGSFGGSAAFAWLNSLNFLSINNAGLSAFTPYGLSIGSATFGESPLIQLYTPTGHQSQIQRYIDGVGPDWALRFRDDGNFEIHGYGTGTPALLFAASNNSAFFYGPSATAYLAIAPKDSGQVTMIMRSSNSDGTGALINMRDPAENNTFDIRFRLDTSPICAYLSLFTSADGAPITTLLLLHSAAAGDAEFRFDTSSVVGALTILRNAKVVISGDFSADGTGLVYTSAFGSKLLTISGYDTSLPAYLQLQTDTTDNRLIIFDKGTGVADWFFGNLAGSADLVAFNPSSSLNSISISHADDSLALATYLAMTEMTAPSAPAANGVRIYAEDDGGGKTRLMAKFSSGAAQQIAIQP